MIDRETVLAMQGRLGVDRDGILGRVTYAGFFGAVVGRYPGPDLVAIGRAAADCLAAFGVDTPLRLAHFAAQAAAETDFRTFVEIWGPTDAQRRYEGRRDIGNVRTGDGYRYRGRGIFQLTGRANYRRFGEITGLNLEADPDLAARPDNAVRIAAAYWRERGMSAAADRDDIERVTRLINGGLNGIEARRRLLGRARALLGLGASS